MGRSPGWEVRLSLFLITVCLVGFYFVLNLPPSFSGEEASIIEILDHSWKIEEEWKRIKKTKYSWRALVKNNSEKRQKVSLYFIVTDSEGLPLDRNTTSQTVPPGETLEIHSDSYLDNNLVDMAVGSRIKFESRSID